MQHFDVVIVGASFAGLSAARELAQRGMKVCVLERKKEAGQGVHTTGIIVHEAIEEMDIAPHLTRPIQEVRVYSPSLKSIELHSPDYFFLATDTPNMMRFLAERVCASGAEIRFTCSYNGAEIKSDGNLRIKGQDIECRYLIGADGPRSVVAAEFGLGKNEEFLLGVEAEFSGANIPNINAFYCFLNQKLARGYLGWVVPGVETVQVGLATRLPVKPDIDAFIDYIAPIFDLKKKEIVARRGGLIPVGGAVSPLSRSNVFLLGDAAGTVSPLSAGGIHTADYFGKKLAASIAAHAGGGAHPRTIIESAYPKFHFKRLQRFVFEHFAPDWLLDLLLGNNVFQAFVKIIFFKKKKL